MVHQHFMLVPPLTVTENMVLGTSRRSRPWLDRGRRAPGSRSSAAVWPRRRPARHVWQLSVGEQQRVEILKALYRKADLLILDEPTRS